MREQVWTRLRQRGVEVDRAVFDSAATMVDRMLAQEIARYVFGGEVVVRRSVQRDPDIRAALALLRDARTPRDLLSAAERSAQAAARRGDVAATPAR